MPGDIVLSARIPSLSLNGRPVLGQITLEVARGETLAVTGPSGVGKSTLLRVLAGLQTVAGGILNRAGPVAAVFQEPVVLPWRSAADNLTICSGVTRGEALDWLAETGLGQHADLFPRQMSLGQQRRLSLARAFAARPEILLMDEPFVSLDPELADEMMTLFETLRARHGVTTIFVTHSAEEAERLATRTLRLGGSPARVVGS